MPVNYNEIGSSGLDMNRPDFLRELTHGEAFKRYNEMRLNSAIVGALLAAIEQSVRTTRWSWTSESGEDDPRLQLLDDAIAAMSHSWNDHLSEALTMLPFGYAPFEIVYQREEGGSRILWRKFAIRGQDTVERWEFDDEGGLAGLHQRAAPYYRDVFIPIEKLLLYRTRVERNNPEGRSILRNAWVSYYYLKNIMQIEAIGVERDLAGMPVIILPEGADASDTTTSDAGVAKKMVRNIRRDEQEGITLPFGWELKLLATGGTRQLNTDSIITRYEQRILMTSLAQFIMLGSDVGTYALSRDQTDFFNMACNWVADSIAQVMTKFAAPRLLALNGMDTDGISYTHTPVGDVDLTGTADFLMKVGSMLTWTPQDETWLRGLAKLPELDEETIELERERKAQIAEQIRGNIANSQQQDEGDDDETEDEMGLDLEPEEYAGRAAPDDAQRRRWERQLKAIQAAYFKGQYRRVMAGARSMKRAI